MGRQPTLCQKNFPPKTENEHRVVKAHQEKREVDQTVAILVSMLHGSGPWSSPRFFAHELDFSAKRSSLNEYPYACHEDQVDL